MKLLLWGLVWLAWSAVIFGAGFKCGVRVLREGVERKLRDG